MAVSLKLLPRLRKSAFAFPLAALVALVMFMISETSYQQARSTFEALGEQGKARSAIQTLRRSLTDAETGQRGYLLTARKEYLQPYYVAQTEVANSLEWLNRYYESDEDPSTTALMNVVTRAAKDKMSELAETLKLHDEGKQAAWGNLMLSNIGKEQMDKVRSTTEQLLAVESARVAEARRSVEQTLLLNRIGVTAMTALSLLALYMYLRQSDLVVQQREDQRRALQAERDQFETEVVRRTSQLTELARHLQTVREDERNHLARELHDELGALLTSVKLDVARLKSRLGPLTPEVAERMQHLSESLNSGIALKRRIIEDLRPSSLSNLGLVAALEILLREWGQRSEIKVDGQLDPVRLRPSGDLTVYRLVQEALTNINKYARATEVRVRVANDAGQVRVTVADNGVGFDVDAPRNRAHGLLGMRYRLEAEGGNLILNSVPGKGTTIEAHLPAIGVSEAATPNDSPETRLAVAG